MALTLTASLPASIATCPEKAQKKQVLCLEEEDMDLINILYLIGSGSTAQDTTTERNRKRLLRARNEGLTMMKLQHKNICHVFGSLETKKYVVLLLEYCRGGDLFDKLNGSGPMSEAEARRCFVQLASVVSYMHSRGYIHRDIKPENILISAMGELVLTDFGFARTYNPEERLEEWVGTLQYTSPEIVSQTAYIGPEVDVWACGTVLLAMLTAKVPFSAHKESLVVQKIKQGDFRSAISSSGRPLSAEVMHLLGLMLEPDVNKRATIDRVLVHPWILGDQLRSPATCSTPF
jgi:serine/threonine protein kinase